MFKLKSTAVAAALACAVLGSVLPNGAHAAASGSIVYDPTNWVQNLRSTIESIQQTRTQIMQYAEQLNSARRQIQNMRNMDPAKLLGVEKEYQAVMDFKREIDKVRGSVDDTKKIFDRRMAESAQLRLPFGDYIRAEMDAARKGNEAAKARLTEESRVLQRVQDDYAAARKFEGQISSTSGVNESINLMNSQLNRMITQNADLIKAVASNMRSQAETESAQSVSRQQAAVEAEARRKANEDALARQRALMPN